jgi:hypothetical protein
MTNELSNPPSPQTPHPRPMQHSARRNQISYQSFVARREAGRIVLRAR